MAQPPIDVDVMTDSSWQMHYGERFALEGLLHSLRPRVAIEVGRAEGGSLRRLAAHSEEVHSFDLVEGPASLRIELPNVVFHTGDSSAQLPETLHEIGASGREVDFALVDGDHTTDGVRRDAEALLEADCCRRTVIVFHDAANDDVRAGLETVRFDRHPKVAMVMLDFVPGYLVEHGPYRGQIWNGFGLVVLGEGHDKPLVEEIRFDAAAMVRLARNAAMRTGTDSAVQLDAQRSRDRPSPVIAAIAAASLAVGMGLGAAVGRRR